MWIAVLEPAAPDTTCAFVSTVPWSSITMPEPAASPDMPPSIWIETTDGRTLSRSAPMSSTCPLMVTGVRDLG